MKWKYRVQICNDSWFRDAFVSASRAKAEAMLACVAPLQPKAYEDGEARLIVDNDMGNGSTRWAVLTWPNAGVDTDWDPHGESPPRIDWQSVEEIGPSDVDCREIAPSSTKDTYR